MQVGTWFQCPYRGERRLRTRRRYSNLQFQFDMLHSATVVSHFLIVAGLGGRLGRGNIGASRNLFLSRRVYISHRTMCFAVVFVMSLAVRISACALHKMCPMFFWEPRDNFMSFRAGYTELPTSVVCSNFVPVPESSVSRIEIISCSFCTNFHPIRPTTG
jgi:hypothetical protein